MFKIDEKTMFMPKINIKNLIRLKNTKQPRTLHIILGNKAFQKYGEIDPIFHIQFHSQLNGADDLSFTVYKTVDGKPCRLWNQLVNFRLIWVKEYNEWFQIKVAIDDSEPITKKVITATSLCEAELSQRLLTIEINTQEDIERADYINPTVFYNPNETDCSLLHRVLKDKCKDYTIQYVDKTLYTVQRSFSADNVSVYDFLTGTVAAELGCLFLFDTNNRSIYIYDMKTTCLECGYHNEQDFKICPECGCSAVHFPYGKDTNILIDKSTIGSNINLEADTDSIKTCFYVTGGDDTINATLKNISPNGTNQILYFNEDIKSDMPKELVDCLNAYQNLSNHYEQEEIYNLSSLPINRYNQIITVLNKLYPSKKWAYLETSYTGFANLTNALYNALDLKMYLENSMMPTWELENTKASDQLALLTDLALSPVCVLDIDTVSKYTVNNAVLAMAKCIIDTSIYKIETFDYDYNLNAKQWTGKFRIQSYTNESDTAESPESIPITISDDSTDYIRQKIKRAIHRLDNNQIQDIYDIDNKDKFKEELNRYGKSSLTIFSEAIQTVLDILQEENCSSITSQFYNDLYKPYYEKKIYIDTELKEREEEIQTVETVFDSIQTILSTVHNTLNFHQYVGDDLWKLLLSYMREDNYTNENYISDGLSNAQIIQKCEELKEVAKKELRKSGNQQYSISETLTNLLLIKNEQGDCIFEPILDDFCLGNFIRTKIDGQVYKMRLIDIHIDYDNLDTLSVTFSDITKGTNCLSDRLSHTIAQVSSMSTSYSAVKKQAEQGQQANYSIDKLRTDGLNSAQFNVFNTHSTIEIDEHGLLSREYDDVNNFYSDEQLRINNANMIMTKDNWRTTILAIGKQTYTLNNQTYTIYGVNADTVLAGQIISGDIYSSDFTTDKDGYLTKGIHIDLTKGLLDSVGIYMNFNDGSFSFADKKIVYKNNHLTFSNVTINWEHTNSPDIMDIDGLNDFLEQLDGKVETFSQTTDPSLKWDNSEQQEHIGDIWVNVNDGLTKQWNGTSWNTITDSELTTLANSKAQIFTTTPTPPYYIGDLWIQGAQGDILHCTISRNKNENFCQTDWKISSKYTDDSLPNAIKNALHFTTTIDENSIISPYIGGGYLNIGDNKTSVIINPLGIGETNKNNYDVFGVYNNTNNKKTRIVGINTNGDAYFNGEISTQKGTIGGWTIDTVLTATAKGYINPSNTELQIIVDFLTHKIETPPINLYDFSGDGLIDLRDLVTIKKILSGVKSFSECSIAQKSDITIKLNPTDTDKTICISGNNMWGNYIESYFGINKVKTNIVECDNISITGLLSSTSGSGALFYCDYDENSFRISNTTDQNRLNDCELSVWGTQKIKYNLHVLGTVYNSSGAIHDSDRNIKSEISLLNIDDSANFIYSLKPSQFKFKTGASNRFHHGLIAQDVKESMGTNDWGLYIDKSIENNNWQQFKINNETNEKEKITTAQLGLRYEELIADLIATVQSQNERIKKLEEST